MKILIVGLGLIGGSYAMGLSRMGHQVYGMDQNLQALVYAKQKGYIQEEDFKVEEVISFVDVIILSIYPQAILSFMKEYQAYFKENQIITDVCGVKCSFIYDIQEYVGKAIYVSHHPMAGKEKIGIEYADADIFKGANFLITPLEHTPLTAIKKLDELARDLGFKTITVISPEKHDQMIGFTSQLTHAIAVSLVNSDHDKDTVHFIGDSYRDLTRIAMINEKLWSELFLENRAALLAHMESFERELDILKEALKENDKQKLEELFQSSTEIRRKMEKCVN